MVGEEGCIEEVGATSLTNQDLGWVLETYASVRKYPIGDHVVGMNKWGRASAHKSFPPNVGGVFETFIGCVAWVCWICQGGGP